MAAVGAVLAVALLLATAGESAAGPASVAHGGAEDPTGGPGDPSGAGDEAGGEPREVIRGRLRHGDEAVEGVRIVVELDGEPVGSAVSGDDGAWRVAVPRPATYQVTLETATLPDDVELAGPQTLPEVRVLAGQSKTVVFRLGGDGGAGAVRLRRLVNLLAVGFKFGALLAMAAVGLSLIFSIAGLINFAHGELVAFGAVVAWFLNAAGGGPHLHLVPAALLTLLAAGALGFVLERGVWRPLRARGTGTIALLVVAIGLALVGRHLYLLAFGGSSLSYVDYTIQRATPLGPVSLPPKDYVITAIALAVLALVGLFLQRSRTGTAMRAVADNRDLAESSGIDVDRVILTTWVLATVLAAVGGILLGVTATITWDMGLDLLLLMFAAVILGGLGTAFGAMVGGILIGVIAQTGPFVGREFLGLGWMSTEFELVLALVVLIGLLLVRPRGLLGHAGKAG